MKTKWYWKSYVDGWFIWGVWINRRWFIGVSRTFLLLLSLSAVAVGQAVYTTSDGAMAASRAGDMCLNTVTNVWATCTPMKPKPHKHKPPVKTPARVGWDTGDPHLATLTVFDPRDGISCVGPVEMLPKKCESCSSLDVDGRTCKPIKCPDKAAVPVELAVWNVEPLNPFRTQTSQWANGAVVTATGTEIVALLPKEEYEHLQQLRAAVVEEEKRLAVEYGAQQFVHHPYVPPTLCIPEGCPRPIPDTPADHYEFHGQFLLIDKGK